MAKLKPITVLPLLTPTQASAVLGIGRTKFLELVRSGRIPAVMLDGRIRVKAEDLQAFRDALPTGYTRGATFGKSATGVAK